MEVPTVTISGIPVPVNTMSAGQTFLFGSTLYIAGFPNTNLWSLPGGYTIAGTQLGNGQMDPFLGTELVYPFALKAVPA
jgi:hypothetical protein